MSKVFVTADLHFSHDDIIRYENRPFKSVTEMNEAIISNWNAVVSNQDTVFVLGDVSFAGKEDTKGLITRLHGNKVLVMGNHDRDKTTDFWREAGFNEVSKYPIVYKEFVIMSHEPPAYFNFNTPYAFIYGHVHLTDMYRTITKNTACVSMERWNYTPVDIEKLFELMNANSE